MASLLTIVGLPAYDETVSKKLRRFSLFATYPFAVAAYAPGVNNPLKMHKAEINIIVIRNFIFITFYIVLSVFFLTDFLLQLKSVMRMSSHIYAQ